MSALGKLASDRMINLKLCLILIVNEKVELIFLLSGNIKENK